MSKIKNILRPLRNYIRQSRIILKGYFQNKAKYKKYNQDTVFILGVPEYGNRGDQAIAFSEYKFILETMKAKEIVMIPEVEWYSNLLCLIMLTNKKNNLCALMGGGNMGELYPLQENIRLSAVKFLKKAKLVVFPQSIDYLENSATLNKAKKIYESHRNLTIFTREIQSENLRKKLFENCKGDMVPDIVLSYIPEIEEYKREGVIFCTRSDKEKNIESQSALDELKEVAKKVFEFVKTVDTCSNEYRCRCEKQINGLNNIWKEFKSSEIVVTDRLHGMIFCAITNTPCIALDNTTGKVGHLYRTWLRNSNILFISNHNELENAIETIKNKKFKNPNVNFEELRKNYSPLIKALVE